MNEGCLSSEDEGRILQLTDGGIGNKVREAVTSSYSLGFGILTGGRDGEI
jgi:hypothetical protein